MKSFPKRCKNKFYYAFSGLFHGIWFDPSIRLQFLLGALTILIASFLSLSWKEWVVILSMVALVIAAEFANSCLEEIVDVLFPYYDEKAKKIKDYGAAFVLLISMIAAFSGLYIIGGKLF